MFHLHKHIGISFRHQWLFSVTRFATTAASAPSADPAPFAVEDYLVASCHLIRDKARKASKALSHLKSPSNPDAVLAFLSGPALGLSPPDIAAAVARDPTLLLCKVDNTLAPRLAELRDFGLSPSQIAQILLLAPKGFRRRDVVSKLQYYIPLFGSFHDFIRALRKSLLLLGVNLESVVKPNVSCLREWSLSAHEISKTCIVRPSLLVIKQEDVRAILVCAYLVAPQCSGMRCYMLRAATRR